MKYKYIVTDPATHAGFAIVTARPLPDPERSWRLAYRYYLAMGNKPPKPGQTITVHLVDNC